VVPAAPVEGVNAGVGSMRIYICAYLYLRARHTCVGVYLGVYLHLHVNHT